MTSNPKTYRTKTGRELTDADIEALADEVEATDYEVARLKPRRGRPPSAPGRRKSSQSDSTPTFERQ